MTALPKAACIIPTNRDVWQMGWILYTGIPDCPSHKSYVNEGIFKQGIQSQIPCAADAIQQRIHVILNHGHIK